jgi:hypothetical protein
MAANPYQQITQRQPASRQDPAYASQMLDYADETKANAPIRAPECHGNRLIIKNHKKEFRNE